MSQYIRATCSYTEKSKCPDHKCMAEYPEIINATLGISELTDVQFDWVSVLTDLGQE